MKHPGTIVFIDGDQNTVIAENDAATIPEALRFAETRNGKVPVVRVVSQVHGDRWTIREYGPQGELLRSTVLLRED